jgi:hypothetical protein
MTSLTFPFFLFLTQSREYLQSADPHAWNRVNAQRALAAYYNTLFLFLGLDKTLWILFIYLSVLTFPKRSLLSACDSASFLHLVPGTHLVSFHNSFKTRADSNLKNGHSNWNGNNRRELSNSHSHSITAQQEVGLEDE